MAFSGIVVHTYLIKNDLNLFNYEQLRLTIMHYLMKIVLYLILCSKPGPGIGC